MFGNLKIGHIPVATTGGTDIPNDGFDFLLTNSCRFNNDDSASLSRTTGTSTDDTKRTISFWTKRTGIARQVFYCTNTGAVTGHLDEFDTNNKLSIKISSSSSIKSSLITSRVFRDPSAWIHVCYVIDTNELTSTERVKLFVNGERETIFDTETINFTEGESIPGISTITEYIGVQNTGTLYYDGYLTEFNLIDGLALGPESFGEFNLSGLWRPINTIALTFGTNGFRMEFKNSAALGTDTSGNTNTFTPSGLASTDQMVDTPTINKTTMSSIFNNGVTISDGGLTTSSGTLNDYVVATQGIPSSGDLSTCYWEVSVDTVGNSFIGISRNGQLGVSLWQATDQGVAIDKAGAIYASGATSDSMASYTTSDVIMVAVNNLLKKIWFGKNGAWHSTDNPATNIGGYDYSSDITTDVVLPAVGLGAAATTTHTLHFEKSTWTYSAPAGFFELNAANIVAPTINNPADHFKTITYVGNATSNRKITGLNFRPDLVWIKNRDQTDEHKIMDSIRGAGNHISSDSTNIQAADSGALISFDEGGWTMGTGANGYNDDGESFVAWCWNAGDGDPVLNNIGSIQSSVKANQAAGFSIISYTGTGAAGTIGHGLDGAPEFLISKNLDIVRSNAVYHAYFASDPATDYMNLNLTNAVTDDATFWNDTAPTSTVISVGTNNQVNENTRAQLLYAFRSIPGFSKVGSYVGNSNDDGVFVYLGFKPAYLLIKKTTDSGGANDWFIIDSSRYPVNGVTTPSGSIGGTLEANDTTIEESHATNWTDNQGIELLSNGFKLRTNSGTINASGRVYIYIAFAEQPFKYVTAK